MTREAMISIVSHGKPSTAMVGWQTQLSEQDIEGVVDYIRQTFVVLATDPRLQAGKSTYARQCASCHGERGQGSGRAGSGTLPMPDFTTPQAREQWPRGQLIASIAVHQPEFGQPDFSKRLSDSQIGELVDFIMTALMLPDKSTAKILGALEAGQLIYNERCYFCHGYSGNGKTLAASFMKPAPSDFTQRQSHPLTVSEITAVLKSGRAATAMQSFAGLLSEQEMQAVAQFVRLAFVEQRFSNSGYHTTQNGWPDHERYRMAFPFALGEIALTQSVDSLSPQQLQGRQLYLSSCITCHDRGLFAPDSPALSQKP
jgi:mono/diheme cytochrome c family protein